jgi:hypothetical protein
VTLSEIILDSPLPSWTGKLLHHRLLHKPAGQSKLDNAYFLLRSPTEFSLDFADFGHFLIFFSSLQ